MAFPTPRAERKKGKSPGDRSPGLFHLVFVPRPVPVQDEDRDSSGSGVTLSVVSRLGRYSSPMKPYR